MSADKTVGGRTREEEPSAGVGGFSLVDLADAHAWTLEWIGRDPTCGNVPALATLLAKRFAEGQADVHSRGIREGLERAASYMRSRNVTASEFYAREILALVSDEKS